MKIKRKNTRKQKRIIFIGVAFLICIISLTLIIVNFKSNIVFFYSPSELREVQIAQNKVIRVGGLIKSGTIGNDLENGLIFTLTDLEEDLIVYFKGIKPDLFREEQGMVAKGKFDEERNVFIADELLVKHDENYMPYEVKKSLKK